MSALGGAVVYRKGQTPAPLAMPPMPVVVLDTGIAGDTAALVAGVAARRPSIDPSLERLGELTEAALECLGEADSLGPLMNEAQHHLRHIGVSTPAIDLLVDLARRHGATGAKLSGAGGGGVVLALTPDGGASLLAEARARGVSAFGCVLPSA